MEKVASPSLYHQKERKKKSALTVTAGFCLAAHTNCIARPHKASIQVNKRTNALKESRHGIAILKIN
ncbi:hypothetical protein ACOSP7_007633 [Xanthoceras sorbifolium]